MGLEVLSDLSEVIPYPVSDFPLYAGIGTLESANQYMVCCHFHPDFEFSLVLEGCMDYFVNGKNIHLETGDGIFVNSRRLHYNYSGGQTPCKYLVLTISPDLFPNTLPAVKRLLEDKADAKCGDYQFLKKEDSGVFFSHYWEIFHEAERGFPDALHALSCTFALCSKVMPMIPSGTGEIERDAGWISLWDMTEYIHSHYGERITLSDISAAGKVCRSKCCQVFTKYMGQTPIEYLIGYRLRKSQKMLKDTQCSIGEVAAECGFSGQSYFAQVFRKAYGVSPGAYRKE